jgi:hypothetical protein
VPNAVVTVVENNPVVSVTESDVNVAVTETAATIALGVTGLQGSTGPTGPQGSSGVIAVTAPITNSGSSTSAQLGLDQTAITITESQVTNLTTDLAAKAALTATQTITGTQTIISGNDANATLILKANSASPTGNLLEIQSSGGSVINRIGANNAFYFGTSGSFLSSSGRILTIPNATNVVPITIQGIASQSADLLQIQDSAAAVLFRITSAGRPQVNARMGIVPAGATSNFAATLTVADVTGGASNIQEWQNSAGTLLARVTATGLGSFNGGFRGFDQSYVQGATAGTVQFFVRGAASQSANLQEWQNSDGTILNRVTSGGALQVTGGSISVGTTSSYGSRLNVAPVSAADLGIVVRGFASQTGNLQEWQNSSGTINALVDAFGGIQSNAYGIFNAGSATTLPMRVRGAASQSANLQEWQNSAATVIGNITVGGQLGINALRSPGGGSNRVDLSGSTDGAIINAIANNWVGLVVRPLTSTQFGDLAQYRNSGGTVFGGRNANAQIYTGSTSSLTTAVGGATTAASGNGTTATLTTTSNHNLAVGDLITVAGVTPTGYNGDYVVTAAATNSVSYANATTGAQTVAGTVSVDAQVSIVTKSNATTGLIVKASGTQTSNLQEWQNSGGGNVASISAGGNIAGQNIQTSSNRSRMGEVNSGGFFQMQKASASQVPGTADYARLFIVAGTVPGTLKLVVRAGTAGAETTILDNIPQ